MPVVPAPAAPPAAPPVPDRANRTTFNGYTFAWRAYQKDVAYPYIVAALASVYANAVAAEAAAQVKNTDSFKGVWSGATTYAQGESVFHAGAYWLSNAGGNLNNTPSSVSAHWSGVFDFSTRAQVHAAILSM